MWIPRQITPLLNRLVSQRPAVVLTGARQAGKTTLLQNLFPTRRLVTLDLPATAALANDDPQSFLERNPPPLTVDEVQYAPGLFRYLKADIDQHRSDKGRFILTGSQKFLLMEGVSDSLAGRVSVVELEPLSWAEVHAAMPKRTVESIVLRGGYPELWAEPDLDHRDYYRSYLATYLERDVRSLLNVGSLRDFERFVRACALRSGQLLNKAEVARDAGISPPTANQWLNVLIASNQVFLLEPWFSNASKSVVKTPKLYWTDAGFLCWLLGLQSGEELLRSHYLGAVWETFVCAELRKRQTAIDGGSSLFFWRDRGREVDFLIHRGGTFELMDAKWTRSPSPHDAQSLHDVADRLGRDRVLARRIICRCDESFPLGTARAVGLGDALFEGDLAAL